MSMHDESEKVRSILLSMARVVFYTVCASAGIVMIAWHHDLKEIIQLHSEFAPMQYNVAVGLFISGLGAVFLSRNSKTGAVTVCGSFVFVLGAMTLAQYALATDYGIDELFFKHNITFKTYRAGRMSINSAISFMVVGLVFLVPSFFKKWSRGDSFVGLCSPVICAIALVTLFGYFLDIPSAIGWWDYTQMAFHTAFLFFILGAGLIFVALAHEPVWFRARWLPYATGILLLVLSFIMWNGLRLEREHNFGSIEDRYGVGQTVAGHYWVVMSRQTWLPEVILCVSVLLSVSLSLMAYLLQLSRVRERQMKENLFALHQTKDELRIVLQNLEEFSFVVSHDMKAPLRGIGLMVDIIKEDHGDNLDSRIKELLGSIETRIERMRKMIDGILECARATWNKGPKDDVCLKDVLRDVMAIIPEPRHAVVLIPDKLPWLFFSRVQLEQVFLNLIGNALKLVDRPGGVVEINCLDQGKFWHFMVKDNGPGIDPVYHDRIFQIFLAVPQQQESSGTGIGLTIVKKIVDLNGGRIWVESNLGKGCCFHFELPKNSGFKDPKSVRAA